MGTLSEIRNQVTQRNVADEIRRFYLKTLKEFYNEDDRDIVIYASDFTGHKTEVPASSYSIELKDIRSLMSVFKGLTGTKLDLILHSPGGALDAADQIVQYLRRKYDYIRVIVPQNAMSAATMIACAADVIVLGKHSALGPTDPWLNGLSAHSILSEFETAKKEMEQNPSCIPLWVSRISSWPPGLLDSCQKALNLSEEKVAEWLGKYMFPQEKNQSKAIAKWLADAKIHKIHNRPLGIEILKERGLKIEALEEDQKFQENVLSVFHATIVTFETTNCIKLVENHKGEDAFLQVNQFIPLPQ